MKFTSSVLVLAASLFIATPLVFACGFDGLMEDSHALSPHSIEVAVAVRQAADQGLLDASLLDAHAAKEACLPRPTKLLRELGSRFSANEGVATLPSMTMLFVESSLWTRYTSTSQGVTPQVHVEGPEQGDVVVVTSEAVIAAILAGRLSTQQAMSLGLIAFDGPVDAMSAATTLFAAIAPDQTVVALRGKRS